MEEDEQIPVLTKDHLRTWQKALLEVWIKPHWLMLSFSSTFYFSIGRCVLFGKC